MNWYQEVWGRRAGKQSVAEMMEKYTLATGGSVMKKLDGVWGILYPDGRFEAIKGENE